MKGLELAANDSLRGVLTDEQLRNIQDAIGGVVADLAEHDDADPGLGKAASAQAATGPQRLPVPGTLDPAAGPLGPVWSGAASVLCVAARGPLDEAANAMLAQLLGKHGLQARVVGQDAVARGAIGSLDVTGVAMVCVSYLEASGSPSALRYLMRRLRTRAPGATVLVGLWQADQALLEDERLRAAVGADQYVTTLRDAVAACVAAAQESQHLSRAEPVPA